MNDHVDSRSSTHATALAWISACAVVLLLLAFFAAVSSNASVISNQITLILDGPPSARTEASCIVIQDSLHQLAFATSVLATAIVIALIVCIAMLRRKGRIERELRSDLEKALDEARRANKSKSTFLSNVAHDIRTPLNAITGFTFIAREHLDDCKRVEECLDHITVSSKNLLDLINDVLDMGAIESGKLMLNEERFSLPQFVYDFIMVEEPLARLSGLSLDIEIGTLTQAELIGDSRRLRKILSNLTSNAVKYTPESGTITLSLSEERLEDEGYSNYWFSVEDTGVGMKPDFINRIFEPFEREANTTTQAAEGTGLGMSITKSTLDLIGGRIEIESEPDVGSRFTVVVPLRIPAVNAARCKITGFDGLKQYCAEARSNARPYAAGASYSGRALLVEDDELNQIVAAELISSFGAEVEIAEDGVEALELFDASEEGAFDIIFMDWQMPNLDGLDTTRAIREREKERGWNRAPIIAMTANAFDEEREQALAAGMDGFIAKPISLATIEHFLKKHLPAKPTKS